MYNGVTNRRAEKAIGKRAGWDWGDILSFPNGFELYVKKEANKRFQTGKWQNQERIYGSRLVIPEWGKSDTKATWVIL